MDDININELNFPELSDITEPYSIQAMINESKREFKVGSLERFNEAALEFYDSCQLVTVDLRANLQALRKYQADPSEEHLEDIERCRETVDEDLDDVIQDYAELKQIFDEERAAGNITGPRFETLARLLQTGQERMDRISARWQERQESDVDMDEFHDGYTALKPEDRIALDSGPGKGLHRASPSLESEGERTPMDGGRTPKASATPTESPFLQPISLSAPPSSPPGSPDIAQAILPPAHSPHAKRRR